MTSTPIELVCNEITYTRRLGPGACVVFLHGIGSSGRSFNSLINGLPETYDVFAWNAPGYGGSAALDDPWPTAKQYAERLAEWLRDVTPGPVHLVGHSLGTLIAAAFSKQFSERVASLTLASAACGYQIPKGGDLPSKVQARITDLRSLGAAEFAKQRSANLVYQPTLNPEAVRRVQAEMSRVDVNGYTQAVHMLASGDLPADLAHVAVRPTFIIGEKDRVTPIDQTHRAAASWTQAHGSTPGIKTVAEAGHAVYIQKPDAFSAALVDAISQPNDAPGAPS